MLSTDLTRHQYDTPRARQFFERLEREATALPGVLAAGLVRDTPMGFANSGRTVEHTDRHEVNGAREFGVVYNQLSPGAFDALRLRVIAGRPFDAHDDSAAALRAVVTQSMAEELWPGVQDVSGRQFKATGGAAPIEVVGVLAPIPVEFPAEAPQAQYFVPVAQATSLRMALFVRTRGDPLALLPSLRELVTRIDPAVALSDLRSMESFVYRGKAFFLNRLATALALTVALLGLLQTLVGLYGVIAYGVQRRQREFGVRLALGALPHDIVVAVMRSGVVWISIGVTLGVVAALLVLPAARGVIVGVSPTDAATYVGSALLLVTLALVSAWLPARRAAAAEPTTALRSD
jgi:hypothetical protein